MQGLVTDRSQWNVTRLKELAAKGWAGMTADEQAEWLGSPLTETAVNLLPYAPVYASGVTIKRTNSAIIATAEEAGSYQYAVLIIGEAADFVDKTMTLSCDHIGTADGGTPQLALYWHDGNGFEYANASLSEAGSITFDTGENSGEREYLAMYIYVTGDADVEAGASAIFKGVMLEFGEERHEYVPYVEILPNDTTKGAYNYSDLNRVERAAAEISDRFGLNLTTKTDWGMWDVPTRSDMERYLTNIKKIRQICSDPNSVGAVTDSMDKLTYNDANNIEKVLLAASEESTEHIYRSGELYCGEVQ